MLLIGFGYRRHITNKLSHRQNGDPRKNEIAFAQTYFAVQTRKQEIIEQRLAEVERIHAREKLSNSEKQLFGLLFERGITDNNVCQFTLSIIDAQHQTHDCNVNGQDPATITPSFTVTVNSTHNALSCVVTKGI